MANYEIELEVQGSSSASVSQSVEIGDEVSEKNAEAWAVGKRNGVDVASTDPTYHNNSKYYADQAADNVSQIAGLTAAASTLSAGSAATVVVSDVDGHKHLAFGIPTGNSGKDFRIKKTFASIAAMQAYDPDQDPSTSKMLEYDFAMIDTGSVEDVDTGKLYCYEPHAETVWHYIGDLSGKQGIKGETGNGIASCVLNNDYTLTITFTDGTSYTSPAIRGATGQTGATGNGIASCVLNNDYTLTITFTDGTSYTSPSIRGETGQTGATGADGVSPSVSVSTITGGHQVSVTDASGTDTFDVMDGTDGSDGTDGTNAYVHIRYASAQPTSDSDMKTTADDWIGIYSGSSATAPTTYTSYTWYKIKGETGQVSNVYGTTIPMSDQDSTKVATAIGNKADLVTGATTGNFAGLDSNGNLTDSGHKHSDYIPASEKAAASGVASLGSDGKVPSAQLPGIVSTVTSKKLSITLA